MTFFSSLKKFLAGPACDCAAVGVSKSQAAVVSNLRAAARVAPTAPIDRAKAEGWRPPARLGGRGGGAAAYVDDGTADFDYFRYFDDTDDAQLAGWTDDLAKIGVDLAKGAASGALTTVARGLSPGVSPKAPPPPPPGMSMTAKLAIGAAVAVPVVYLLTRKRSSPTPVAA